LYLTGIEYGGVGLALAMAAATGLALFYYVRAIHRVWLGPPHGDATAAVSEPKIAAFLLVVLIAATLLLGLFPGFVFGQV
jgi:NADH:ubiquinone oxidoreductase subunit 2 (subunit N)